MSEIEWKPAYSVGNEAIDHDHQGLFDLVRELAEADMTDGLLNSILVRLGDYAVGHFSREETLMKKIDYPGLEEHIKQHQAFVEWIRTVKKTYNRAPESPFIVGDHVNNFLQYWLVQHIMQEDMKYRDFLIEKK